MVDVAVTAQLQQWSGFEKPVLHRPMRSDSSASSPDLSHREPETLRIDATVVETSQTLDTKDTRSFQERYLSSEEDLSPCMDDSSDYDSDVSIHEVEKQCLSARRMSVSRWEKGKSCDMAVLVSYTSAGKPKMVDLIPTIGSPIRETAQRSASLAQLPIAAINKLRKDNQARRSLMVSSSTSRSASPAISFESRRPSTGHSPFSHNNNSTLRISESSSSSQTAASTRSTSPSVSDNSTTSARPATAAAQPQSAPRSSLYIVSSNRDSASKTAPFPPLTPQSPEPHSFLSSDPYENSQTNAASPIIKSGPHKRLRSISQKLSLAKIAITPSTKKWDSRINGRANMPPTPATPYTPMTPQTAPPTSNSSPMKLRRNSRILSRPSTQRGPTPEVPPVPTMPVPSPRKVMQKRMIARGADEREPMLELPPFPAEDKGDTNSQNNSIKARRVRKRKSLMDLL